jgi:hypothetical protein
VALGIFAPVATVTIGEVDELLGDLGACGPGPLVVAIDVLDEHVRQ